MKRKIIILISSFIWTSGCSVADSPQATSTTISPAATKAIPGLTDRSKAGIMAYLAGVIKDSLVVVGQHCENGNRTAEGYQAYVENLYKQSGKYPALIAVEYGYSPNNDLSLINQTAIPYWKKGGLVSVTWHADNPWVEGYNCRWNSITNKDAIHLEALLKQAPESEAKANYRNELMKVGAGLKQLQEAGVTVLWRPFHEMNGSWFWWGANDKLAPTNKAAYQRLWQDMHETLTIDFGLKNLIWIYGPNAQNGGTATLDALYPGTDYVDIVGVDIYSKVPEFLDYERLKVFKKPIVVGEVGPVQESYGAYDELEVLKAFRGKAAWFLQWSSWTGAKVAIIDNRNYQELMKHPAAITLDEL